MPYWVHRGSSRAIAVVAASPIRRVGRSAKEAAVEGGGDQVAVHTMKRWQWTASLTAPSRTNGSGRLFFCPGERGVDEGFGQILFPRSRVSSRVAEQELKGPDRCHS